MVPELLSIRTGWVTLIAIYNGPFRFSDHSDILNLGSFGKYAEIMKKTIIVFLPFLALALSGCSIGQQQAASTQDVPTVPGGLLSQNEKGSIWKSEDGGQTFKVKSTVDQARSIDTAEILSITFHPTKPKTIILGTVSNGVFKTDNGGDTWNPIPFPPKRIYSFILDRRNPDNRMFVSGVVNTRGKIFRTDDAGANWTEVYTEPGSNTFISSLAQDLWNPDIIYAGTTAGVILKSLDAGATWKDMGSKSEYGIVTDIVFDAKIHDSVSFLSFQNKMYHSSDGGNTWIDWSKVKQDQKSANPPSVDPGQILSLVADPSRSGVLYAGTSSSGVFRSQDDGKDWTKLNIIESAEKFPIRSIAVDPKNSDHIVFVAGKGFYRSLDSGATWSVTALNSDRSASVVAYDPFDSQFLFIGIRNATK